MSCEKHTTNQANRDVEEGVGTIQPVKHPSFMHKVLLLGAEPATAHLYRAQFERAGIGMVSSEITMPIEDVVRLAKPAALVVDLSRGKPDGETLLRGIRSQAEFINLPIFTLTSRPLHDAAHGTVAGRPGTCFQNLPLKVPDVVKAVTDSLSGRSAVKADQGDLDRSPSDGQGPPTKLEPNKADLLIDDSNAHLFRPAASELQRKLSELGGQLAAKELRREGVLSKSRSDVKEMNDDDVRERQPRERLDEQTQSQDDLTSREKQTDPIARNREPAEEQLKAARERQSALECELSQAATALAQAGEQTSKFAAEVERLTVQLESTRKENDVLKTRVDELQALNAGTKTFLQQKLEAMAAYDAISDELGQVRNQLAEERSHRQSVEAAMLDLEVTKEELTEKIATISESDVAQQQAVQTLGSKLEDAMARLSDAASSLQAQTRESRRLELRCKELEEKVKDLAGQVSSQTAIEKALRRQEAELRACLLEQQGELERSRTALGTNRAAIRCAKESIEGRLYGLVQELNGQIGPLLEDQRTAAGSRQETEPVLRANEKAPTRTEGEFTTAVDAVRHPSQAT